MIRLQTYFMFNLEAPNLIWNAVLYNWPWNLHLQQEAIKAGFDLEKKGVNPADRRYRLELVIRDFFSTEKGFTIEDVIEYYDETGYPFEHYSGRWIVEGDQYFYYEEKMSFKEWHAEYVKTTKEHVERFG